MGRSWTVSHNPRGKESDEEKEHRLKCERIAEGLDALVGAYPDGMGRLADELAEVSGFGSPYLRTWIREVCKWDLARKIGLKVQGASRDENLKRIGQLCGILEVEEDHYVVTGLKDLYFHFRVYDP